MKHLIDSVESSLTAENWYAALTVALTLPDIAGKIDSPNSYSSTRYPAWFETYVGKRYTTEMSEPVDSVAMSAFVDDMLSDFEAFAKGQMEGNPKYEIPEFTKKKCVFLSGKDCYALRCSFLHEGISDVSHQKAKEVLNNFEFVAPVSDKTRIHNNLFNNRLQLQVDIFCRDILYGIEEWLKDISGDTKKQSRLNVYLKIHEIQ